ncbi:Sel1 repeat family protein (plasmid) [Paraburkholderia kururiensis]
MGDYLYALGNAEGWLNETADPLKIRDLFNKAAQEGSSDAKIVLGIYYLLGAVPSIYPNSIWLPEAYRNQGVGLQLIRDGMKERCTYAEPVVNAYSDQLRMRYVSAASRVWPAFRDGRSSVDSAGHVYPVIEKNARLEGEWRELDKRCHALGAASE